MLPLVLLVEPNSTTSVVLQRALAPLAHVVASSGFKHARDILRERTPDLLITNLRLAAYNGLHLVLTASPETRSVVYSTAGLDPMLAVEAQRQAAFYESGTRLLAALPAYVRALLPTRDRRDVVVFDRRWLSRGGRRASDGSTPATGIMPLPAR
jgi:DNA-binding NtrC family response regulator